MHPARLWSGPRGERLLFRRLGDFEHSPALKLHAQARPPKLANRKPLAPLPRARVLARLGYEERASEDAARPRTDAFLVCLGSHSASVWYSPATVT